MDFYAHLLYSFMQSEITQGNLFENFIYKAMVEKHQFEIKSAKEIRVEITRRPCPTGPVCATLQEHYYQNKN